ncbi:hypothetical protein DAEQUDRAFT_570898 [Daedalea quercina L-15889]|uniref:F-box domain-containing protein n=1 Tax=Daedalea quercina L-15889 TaxID=1314783 RepID=A0A165LUI2_9APHY|nr:hypothetical protein DAEQUDRAFT_570898 [Daedalea quercina L-15889]
MPLANRLVHDGVFAEICRVFSPSLDLTDPELNDPEAHRQIPRRVRADRMALASLAQVHRAFAEVALDALWKQLDSPEPLLRLLLSGVRRVPVDDPKLAEDPFEGGVLISFGLRPSRQRKRFAFYSARVKSLRLLKEVKIHPSVFFQAAMACDVNMKASFLPFLEELYCEPSDSLSQAIMLFTSPKLFRVTLSLSDKKGKSKRNMSCEDFGLASIMNYLAYSSPAVQELSIAQAQAPQALHTIHALRNIQTLNIQHTECTGLLLQRLACFEHLTRLTVTASLGGYPTPSNIFSKLKHVRFVKGTFVGAARVILSLGLCQLTSLEIDSAAISSAYCLKELSLSTLSLCLRSEDTLDALFIRATVVLSEDKKNARKHPSLALSEFLDPFFLCKKLSNFAVGIQQFVTMTDDDLIRIGSKWPVLTRLDLSSVSVPEPHPSFVGISQLAKSSPHLRVVKLSDVAAPTPDPLEWPPVKNGLKVLVIAKQHYPRRPVPVCADDRAIIAQIADRLFPNLDPQECCEATKALPNGADCRWRKIVDELAYQRYLRKAHGKSDSFIVRVSDRMLEEEGCDYPSVYVASDGTLVDGTEEATFKVYKRM